MVIAKRKGEKMIKFATFQKALKQQYGDNFDVRVMYQTLIRSVYFGIARNVATGKWFVSTYNTRTRTISNTRFCASEFLGEMEFDRRIMAANRRRLNRVPWMMKIIITHNQGTLEFAATVHTSAAILTDMIQRALGDDLVQCWECHEWFSRDHVKYNLITNSVRCKNCVI